MAATDTQRMNVVDALYGASLAPERWPKALGMLADACGAAGVTVFRFPASAERALTSPSLQPVTADYAATWWEHDSRAPRFGDMLPTAPIRDRDLFTEDEIRRDPFYQEFLKGHGLGHFAAMLVTPLPGLQLVLTVERGSDPFRASELAVFTQLGRQAAQALAATARLGLSEDFADELAAVAERQSCGVISIDANGQVSFASSQANRLLGDGLTIAGRQLAAVAARDQTQLDRLIACALPGSPIPPLGSIFVGRPSGKSPLLVQAVPLRPRHQPGLEQLRIGRGGVLLLIHDLAARSTRSVVQDLQRMGLTRAQARVAELVGYGRSLREAAGELGVTEATARTQLKAVFRRLGMSRQSELTILVTKLAALVHD